MSISEQLRRIFKVAPHFPYQVAVGIFLLIGTVILTYKGFGRLLANWIEGTAELVEYSEIQERTRESKPDYFYKIYYKLSVNDQDYQVTKEQGYRTSNLALQSLEEEIELSPVWYSSWNPNRATFSEDETKWQYFFFALIPVLLVLSYLRWIFLKYYELEIEE